MYIIDIWNVKWKSQYIDSRARYCGMHTYNFYIGRSIEQYNYQESNDGYFVFGFPWRLPWIRMEKSSSWQRWNVE